MPIVTLNPLRDMESISASRVMDNEKDFFVRMSHDNNFLSNPEVINRPATIKVMI
jgi:hypothetical protein